MTIQKNIPTENMTAETKCGFCSNSKCCTYITQEISTPRSKHDFEFLLWQVSHNNVRAYKDEGTWYVMVDTPCNHLQDNGRCMIYDQRPSVCREYSNDYCEFDAPAEDGFDLYFDGYQALLKYCKKRYKRWGQ